MKYKWYHIFFTSLLFNLLLLATSGGDVNFFSINSIQSNVAGNQSVCIGKSVNNTVDLAVAKPAKNAVHFFSQTTKSVSSERLRHKKAYERDITLLHNFPHQIIFILKESPVTFPDTPLLQPITHSTFRRGPPAVA